MKFIDQTEIHVSAGRGGDGMLSFRTARNMPKLGPDGGNGGIGGSVYLVGKKGQNTLSSLRYRQLYRAADGGKGGTNNKTGKTGAHKVIHVPLGTVVKNREDGSILGEILEAGQKLAVAQGGRRGYGNLHYVSATNRAPRQMTHGQKGESRSLCLELKLLADVGFAGLPNAGKSTLLSRLSAARPKVADYPFTTLVPNLGVMEVFSGSEPQEDGLNVDSLVLADVPGLIEGASVGKGLGHHFLRHLERTALISYVVDPYSLTDPDPALALAQLQRELADYSAELAMKPFVVVFTKKDMQTWVESERETHLHELCQELDRRKTPWIQVSSIDGTGLANLKNMLVQEYCLLKNGKINEEVKGI
ncbi:MAG: Obg family GTPase CgtA [Zetaproteobacteria bacterium]|nr:Obg family GTPase CgtA [Zetaproteobacteria bacterium]